jgi:hypothetical protein
MLERLRRSLASLVWSDRAALAEPRADGKK